MMWLLGIVGSRLGKLAAIVLGALGTILLVFNLGKRDQKKHQELRDLKDYKKVREKVDEVPTDLERDDAVDRMRNSGLIRKD